MSRFQLSRNLFKPLLALFWGVGSLTGCNEEERAEYYVGDAPVYQTVTVPPASSALEDQRKGYPDGPYASANPKEGDTVADLPFYGFHRLGGSSSLVSEADYGEISFSDYRDSGAEYLLIHVAAAWCSSCLQGAVDLQFAADQVVAAGGELIELVIDGDAVGVDPNKDDLELWIDYGGLTFSTLGPGLEVTRDTFPDREHVYIIDLDSMQVVWTGEGLYNNPSVAQLALEELLGRYLQD